MIDWLGLAGRSALVVGAGGLGGATVTALAAQGVHAVTFLLSDRAAFITGQCLYVDGGRTLV